MVERIWTDLCRRHAELLENFFAEPSESLHDHKALVDAMQLFIAYASLLARTQERLFLRAVKSQLFDLTATGHWLSGYIHAALKAGDQLSRRVELGKAVKQPVVREPNGKPPFESLRPEVDADAKGEFARALTSLKELLETHTTGWPWIDHPTLAASREIQEKGQTLESDDAFAQIRGITREAWLELVEEHKRQRRAVKG